jgi:hypothetical protein
MTRRLFSRLSFSAIGALFAGCVSASKTSAPVRRFELRFRHDDVQVPEGVIWKLTWRSPYKAGEITPGYDVRIIEGQARIGREGELIARAFDSEPGNAGFLDLQAPAGETAVIWLEAGTRFQTANDRVALRIIAFSKKS